MKDNGTTQNDNGRGGAGALHVAFVLDESGSMRPLVPGVLGGFDEFLDELRDGGAETLFSLTQFDTGRRHVHIGLPLEHVPPLEQAGYRPRGGTALFDAVAHTVFATDERLAAEGRGEEKVMLAVLTDGFENASTEYTEAALAELIRGYEERPNWTFVYLGAAHRTLDDARDFADSIAFKRTNTMVWRADAPSARKSMRSLGLAAKQRRTSALLKSDRLFEDAGQAETDYREDGTRDA